MAAPLPVVAAIQGAAVGGGFGLACTADFRVGSAETRLVANFAQLGVHHGFGLTVTLPLIVGSQRANELLLTGRRVRGEEGHRIGLLDRFVDGHELEAAAIAFAAEIASSSPLAIRAIRATMRQGLVERFRAATDWESQEQARLSGTRDFLEGVRASAERRPTRFTGS
jgi:enoyl-CoA hydratase/carnithine racemase